jgi:hypothetical protein
VKDDILKNIQFCEYRESNIPAAERYMAQSFPLQFYPPLHITDYPHLPKVLKPSPCLLHLAFVQYSASNDVTVLYAY